MHRDSLLTCSSFEDPNIPCPSCGACLAAGPTAAGGQCSPHSMSAAEHESDSPAAAWSMPSKFLPLPRGFSCAGNGTKVDLRSKSHSQLLALAARHNSRQGIKEDPFITALKGIPERSKLRPDSSAATTHTLGNVPADSPYAKAWRSIKRKHVRGTSNKSKANEEAAAKRAEAAATAARLAKLQGKTVQELNASKKQAQQQLLVPPEQVRWRSKLEAFLCRPVVVPRLGPDAPVLDMNKLFLEVMNQGGMQAVTAAGGWPSLALHLQRDVGLADHVLAVYDNYLHPLEIDLPYGFRPARNLDHLEGRAQIRSSMGTRLASYDTVAYAWQHAAVAIKQIPSSTAQQWHQQTQQDHQGSSSCSGVQLVVHTTLSLLREAAVQPLSVVQQLQEHSVAPGLHGPTRDACIVQVRRTFASRRKGRVTATAELSDWDAAEELAVMEKFKAENAAIVRTMETAATKVQAAKQRQCRPGSPVLEEGQQQQQQQHLADDTETEAVSGAAEELHAAKRAKLNSEPNTSSQRGVAGDGPAKLQDQQPLPSLEEAQGSGPSARERLEAVQWLLLSRRAVHSGPPGCEKPALQLPGIEAEVDGSAVRGNTGGSRAVWDSLYGKQQVPSSSTSHRGKQSFQGGTPKCGSCRTCTNPSLKKACAVNRERMAQGLHPLLPTGNAANAATTAAESQQPE